ncbi:MAG: thiol reductant ABC exporter subunit CydD [Chloroflexota bacterium]
MHRRLIRLTQSSRLVLSVGIGCGVLAGLCSLAQAYALSATVDGVFLGEQPLTSVWPWLRLLLGVIVARGVLLWLQEIAASEVAVRIKRDLRERLFAHLLKLGPAFSRGERSGELTSTAVDGIEALDAYFGQYLPQLVISVLVPVTILLAVFPLDPLSGIILLLTAPLIPFFMYMIGRTAEVAIQHQYETLGRLSSHLLDSLQGLTTLKLFGQSAAQVKNIAGVADQFRDVTLGVLRVSFLSAFALELLATISTAIIAVEVGLRLLYGHMAFREALFLLILAPEFYLPLRMLGARFHAGMAGTAAARRIFEILDFPAPAAVAAPSTAHSSYLQGSRSRPESEGSGDDATPAVLLRDVSYTYPGRDWPALEHIDLAVRRGEHIALVGASGSGKTTLASLLLRFMRPTHGDILLNGKSLESVLAGDRSTLIGWVPQRPHLFHDSIATNLRLGKPDASHDEMLRAARLAHLDEFIESLPQGYAAIVGEGGARLSSGEAQRLALARAFLMDAAILILDEVSSSLDPENEALIEASVRHLTAGHTVITIAHRLNTVYRADRIVVLHQGRLVEQGAHADLLATGGAYARLIDASPGGSLRFAAANVEPEPTGPRGGRIGRRQLIGSSVPAPALLNGAEPAGAQPVLPQLLEFLKGSLGLVALSVILGSLTIGSSVALMGTSAWLISAAALHPSIALLQVAIVGVRLFGISRAVFRYLERLVSHAVTFRLLRNIRVWFYSRLEPLAPARLLDFKAGDLVARAMADVETLENLYVRVLAPPFTALVVAAGTCILLILNKASAAAVLLASLFFLAGVVVPLSARSFARRPGARMIGDRADLHAQVVDGIQGLADILAFGRAADRIARLQTSGAAYAAGQRLMARISGFHSGLSSILINMALWLTLLFVIPAVTAGRINGILLASLALIVQASFEAVSTLPLAGQMWPATQAAANRLLEVVNVPPTVAASLGAPLASATTAGSRSLADLRRPLLSLEFSNVSFAYPGRVRPTIRDLSFRLETGRSIAVVGPSGAGKSTLASLLLRFWEYDSGEIRLGGVPIRASSPDHVRAQIGYVSQHPYLFDTSVYENLRLARRGVTAQEVEQAARRAQIHDLLMSLPKGYETLIGEHGARLSAGERQRLGIARLIIKDAPLLILDEPTANLDAITEVEVLATLFDLMRVKTSLLITHRLVGMEQLDQIIVMDHGAIVERGTHVSLRAAGGLYSRLSNLQSGQQNTPSGPLASAT